MNNAMQTINNDSDGTMSMRTISIAVAFAAITHAYVFGAPAFVAGAIAVALFYLLGTRVQRTGSKALLVIYSLLSLWIIIGFGIINGLWSHGIKSVIALLNGGYLPAGMETWFMDPELGSLINELAGITTFAAAMFAAYYGFKFVRAMWKGVTKP